MQPCEDCKITFEMKTGNERFKVVPMKLIDGEKTISFCKTLKEVIAETTDPQKLEKIFRSTVDDAPPFMSNIYAWSLLMKNEHTPEHVVDEIVSKVSGHRDDLISDAQLEMYKNIVSHPNITMKITSRLLEETTNHHVLLVIAKYGKLSKESLFLLSFSSDKLIAEAAIGRLKDLTSTVLE